MVLTMDWKVHFNFRNKQGFSIFANLEKEEWTRVTLAEWRLLKADIEKLTQEGEIFFFLNEAKFIKLWYRFGMKDLNCCSDRFL